MVDDEQGMGAPSGTGSHVSHEAPTGLRPSGFDPSRVLYHGTSLDRAISISRDDIIKVAPCGVQGVSMTDDINVAVYFAALAADADRSLPIVLPIDADRLRADGFDLERFEDDCWGEGECAWERETICRQDIPASYAARIRDRDAGSAGDAQRLHSEGAAARPGRDRPQYSEEQKGC